MPKRRPIKIGTKYHRLTVINSAPPYFQPDGDKIYCVVVLCICGKEFTTAERNLHYGKVKSCGCWNIDSHTKHLQCDTPTYSSWATMRNRCTNPKNKDYPRYGAVGISVCSRWHDFTNFLADMGARPAGTSIDRYPDPYGNYEPSNCRWGTPKQQANNRRRR